MLASRSSLLRQPLTIGATAESDPSAAPSAARAERHSNKNIFYYKRSNIPNAGLGLFAAMHIKKGERLGVYIGPTVAYGKTPEDVKRM